MPNTQPESIRTIYLYMLALVAAIGGFLFGYDLQLISAAILYLKPEFGLDALGEGLVAGSAILGCPFGPLCGVWLADSYGRKWTLILSAVLFMVSAIGSAVAPTMLQLIIWRFVGGMGVGLASTVSPMYIAEIAPAHMRGRLVVVNQLAIVIGLTLAVVVCWFLSFGEHWRWMFASEAMPIVAMMVGLVLVPRSPRWLAAKGHTDEANAVLTRINGPEQAKRELDDILDELREETGSFGELFRPGVFTAVLIGIVLMVFSQINGVNMVLIYAPKIFIEAGIGSNTDAIFNSIYVYTWISFCTVIAFWLTGRFGRRPLLIVGTIGMGLGHLMIFAYFTFNRFGADLSPLWMLPGVCMASGAFTLTLAPLSWVILSEIFPNRIRGKAMSIATCCMFASSFIVTYFFPSILAFSKSRFGSPGEAFLIFLGICLACTIFAWRWLPETKDRTLEEIGRFWLER